MVGSAFFIKLRREQLWETMHLHTVKKHLRLGWRKWSGKDNSFPNFSRFVKAVIRHIFNHAISVLTGTIGGSQKNWLYD